MPPSDKINLFDLIDLAQLNAIHSALEPTPESLYRIKCRQYSVLFHTPLHLVYELDPLFILSELYAHQYQPNEIGGELDTLLEQLYKIQDPNYVPISQEDTEDLIDMVINKELKRLGKKKSMSNKVDTKNTSEEKKEIKEKLKSGGMSFEDLENKDAMTEGNRGGFKD